MSLTNFISKSLLVCLTRNQENDGRRGKKKGWIILSFGRVKSWKEGKREIDILYMKSSIFDLLIGKKSSNLILILNIFKIIQR